MPGLSEDAAQLRSVRGAEINQILTTVAQINSVFGDFRTKILEIREEVQANAGGEFQPGDLGALNSTIARIRADIRTIADGFI